MADLTPVPSPSFANPGPLMTTDGIAVKLGRIRPKARPVTLQLGNYLDLDALPTFPDTLDYSPKAMKAIRRMYMNDRLGCCVISGKAHSVGIWIANEIGQDALATDEEIVAAYHGICGRGDNGCNIAAVLDFMRLKGITFGGIARKIDGYIAVDWTQKAIIQAALTLFGPVTLGINIPGAWVQSSDGGIWDQTNSRIVGGHDIPAIGWNPQGLIISTWGGLRTMTWAALASNRYVDECYALLSPDWYSTGKSPSGFDAATLKADLAKIGAGTLPPLLPDPTPTPTPTPTPIPTPTPTPTPVPVQPPGVVTLDTANNVVTLPKGFKPVPSSMLTGNRLTYLTGSHEVAIPKGWTIKTPAGEITDPE